MQQRISIYCEHCKFETTEDGSYPCDICKLNFLNRLNQLKNDKDLVIVPFKYVPKGF